MIENHACGCGEYDCIQNQTYRRIQAESFTAAANTARHVGQLHVGSRIELLKSKSEHLKALQSDKHDPQGLSEALGQFKVVAKPRQKRKAVIVFGCGLITR